MKQAWKKMLVALCAALMLMMISGMCVPADEIQEEEFVAAEEVVGAGGIQVGNGVTATFDADTGAVEFTSQNGTLWSGWTAKLRVDREEIKSIRVVSGTVHLPSDSKSMFANCGMTRLDLSHFNTSDVKDMSFMFAGCSNLESLDLSSFDTSHVTTMLLMFDACESLRELNLSSFVTTNVTEMSYMFEFCRSLQSLDLSSFDTSHVTGMQSMFSGCSSLENLDVSSFNTSGVSDMSFMFCGCESLINLDLDSFDTTHVTDMSSMFENCRSLEYLDLSRFVTSHVQDMSAMFYCCESLTELCLGSFNTENVMEMDSMFYGCRALTSLDVSSFNTSNVTEMAAMFGECNSLASLDLSNFNTTRVSDLGAMFRGCSSLTSLDLSSFNTSNVTSMAFMFCECGIPDLDLQCLETASVTNMCGMFSRWSLADLDLSGLDTSGVTDMSHMFSECPRLTNLYLGQFVTSNVTDMSYMFCECPNLTSLDLSHFVTSNVTDMSYMFSGCVQLKKLQLSSFDTTNVTNMHHMFCYCPELENLDVSTFNTSNVTDMECMFESCSLLISLDLSNFVTTNVRSMLWMFEDCSSLVILNIGNFDTSNTEAVDVMLQGCDSLCWLMTPKKNSSRIDLPVALYDASGNVHTELPVTSKSILLTKEKSGYIADISKCTITLSPNSYTYTGAPCQPTVKVNSGNQALDRVLTYNVGYQNNVDAGTAVVTVTGVGLCTGVNTASFTIKKANPILDFGIIGSVQKNSTDPPFTIPLILSITDGNILYRSSDPEIAGVNAGNGMVTPHKPGRVRIYADAQEGSNYLSGSTSYELIIVAATPTTARFSDVQDPTHPYYKAIYWAAGAGIAKGYPDGTFGIDNPCTRGEMIMFLWRFAGKPNPRTVSNSPFKDVPKTHTFYKAVLWAYQQGITKGYGNGTFGVNRNVSRGESMMFLWRLKGKKEPTSVSASPFKDVPKTHTFYKAILWGYQKKITTGYTSGPKKGTFGINENCTRGQIVTFLYRAK